MTEQLPSVDDVQRALDDGDWHTARSVLEALDPTRLTEEERARVDALRAILGQDPVAIGIAAVLGLVLLVIILLLYVI